MLGQQFWTDFWALFVIQTVYWILIKLERTDLLVTPHQCCSDGSLSRSLGQKRGFKKIYIQNHIV